MIELPTRWLGQAHRHLKSTTSTNDIAAAWATAGAPHGALVTADAQAAGRGRFGRRWHSPAGAHVYASFVLRPKAVDHRWGALALAVGVGVRAGLQRFTDAVGLKWPNDLVVGEKKLGGILCESRWATGLPQFVVGIGINVAATAWPDDLHHRAVALGELCRSVPNRDDVLAAILTALEPVLERFEAHGFADLHEHYANACVSLGKRLQLADGYGGAARHVWVLGVDGDGALRVRADDSSVEERIDAGELLLADPR